MLQYRLAVWLLEQFSNSIQFSIIMDPMGYTGFRDSVVLQPSVLQHASTDLVLRGVSMKANKH